MTGGLSTRDAGANTAFQLPVGPLFCIIDGPTRGRAWPATAVRAELRELAAQAAVRRRLAPHQLRHPTLSSSRARGCRSTSSNANSGIPTSARPRLLAGDRPERDRQRCALPPCADDARQRRARPLSGPAEVLDGASAREPLLRRSIGGCFRPATAEAATTSGGRCNAAVAATEDAAARSLFVAEHSHRR